MDPVCCIVAGSAAARGLALLCCTACRPLAVRRGGGRRGALVTVRNSQNLRRYARTQAAPKAVVGAVNIYATRSFGQSLQALPKQQAVGAASARGRAAMAIARRKASQAAQKVHLVELPPLYPAKP